MEVSSLGGTDSPKCFLNLMFKLFFKYLDSILVLWIDALLIYS